MYLNISIYKIFRQITVEIFLKLVYNQLYIDCGRYFKMKAYTPKIMQTAENYMFSKGIKPIDLMKKAASGMFSLINDRIDLFDAIVILCGKGNNAGDGYELARILKTKGYNVVCISVFGSAPATDIAKTCFEQYLSAGGTITSNAKEAFSAMAMADIIIDAVFGIGFKGSIDKDSLLYKLIDEANCARAFRIAIDVPSGVRSDDGSVENIAFVADETLTVAAYKIGMLSYPAKLFCGKIQIVDIGITSDILDMYENEAVVADDAYVSRMLPSRCEVSNKGDFGKLACICGSERMTGAAVLSVEAALRSGVGLVTLISEKSVTDIVKIKLCEPIYSFVDWNDEDSVKALLSEVSKYNALLVGCGLGQSKVKKNVLKQIISDASGQLIIDADGINMLSDNINVLREARKVPIITPHPGEFSRISGLDVDYINDNRIKCAREFSQKHRCITVLKGAGTIIASPDGRYAVNISGNAGLAKGGSGDVLAGLIAGLAANPGICAFEAAVCGVYLHGRAADVLKGKYSEYGLLPSDLSKEFAKMLP